MSNRYTWGGIGVFVTIVAIIVITVIVIDSEPRCPGFSFDDPSFSYDGMIIELEPWLASAIKEGIKAEIEDAETFDKLYPGVNPDTRFHTGADSFVTIVHPHITRDDNRYDLESYYAIGDPGHGPNSREDGSHYFAIINVRFRTPYTSENSDGSHLAWVNMEESWSKDHKCSIRGIVIADPLTIYI